MSIEQIWQVYCERMAEIELFHRATKNIAKKELIKLNEYANNLKSNPELQEHSKSLHNMSFYDLKTGDNIFYGFKELSVGDRYLHVLLHKNKQYQWLLAEAYEEFEDFIENIYAFYGSINNSFWPLKDYGSISLSELNEKNYDWYLEQARKKKDTPKSILNRFRKQFPELTKVEVNNKLDTNLSLVITLVEKLRHIIVHKGGSVDNKNEFIKLVTQESGLYNNGNINPQHIELINQFFGENEYENLITVLEVRVQPEIPLDIYVSLFGKLTNYLMAYAFFLCKQIQGSIDDSQQ